MRTVLFAVSFVSALVGCALTMLAFAMTISGTGIWVLALGIAFLGASLAIRRVRNKRYPRELHESTESASPPTRRRENTVVPLVAVPLFVAIGVMLITRERSIFVDGQTYNTAGRFTSYYLQVFVLESLLFTVGVVAAIRTVFPIGIRYSAAMWACAFALFCLAFRYAIELHAQYIHFGPLTNVVLASVLIGVVAQIAKKVSGA